MTLNLHDQLLIAPLARAVRVATAGQLTKANFADTPAGRRSAYRRFVQLVDAGWLCQWRVMAFPILPLVAPVVRWRPGELEFDNYGAIAHVLQSRWTQPPVLMTVYTASRKTARALGGYGSDVLNRPAQTTHDLHVAELFFRLRETEPERAARWISDKGIARLRDPGDKIPDAALIDPVTGETELVIEWGGSYPEPRVEAFCEDCFDRGLAFELW